MMHPLVAEDFAKVLLNERFEEAKGRASAPPGARRRRLRRRVGAALVRAGARIGRFEPGSPLPAGGNYLRR